MLIKRIQYLCFSLLLGYFLGIHEGYISLWRGEDTKPLQVFPYRAEMLPNFDRQALENRIYLASEQELQQLLEDYLS